MCVGGAAYDIERHEIVCGPRTIVVYDYVYSPVLHEVPTFNNGELCRATIYTIYDVPRDRSY